MISEQAICGWALSAMEELDFTTEPLLPGSTALLPGMPSLLPGVPALFGTEEELSGSGEEGLSHAENAPSIETKVPVKSHFFMFIRAILFEVLRSVIKILEVSGQFCPVGGLESARILVNSFPFGCRITEFRKCGVLEVQKSDEVEHPVRNL